MQEGRPLPLRLASAALIIAAVTALASAQTVDDITLPEVPAGFSWKKIPEIRAAFLIPDNWFYRAEKKDGSLGFSLTDQQIEGDDGFFHTGLTLNVIRKAKKRSGMTAPQYAARFVAEWVAKNDPMDTWQTTVGVLEGHGCRIRTVQAGNCIILHGLAVGNAKTDTLYIMFFESPGSRWESAWDQFGSIMMDGFFLDDEV